MILYEGPSLLDGETPIVAIATEDENPKTGRMLFTWILRQDRPPEVAAYDGSDEAICGDCPFRTQVPIRYEGGAKGMVNEIQAKQSRTCYVRLSPEEGADEAMPPSEVWRKWKGNEFSTGEGDLDADNWELEPMGHARYIGSLPVRIGSYGDPAAVPTRVWAELVRYAKNWTGYTHMWKGIKCHECGGAGKQPLFRCAHCDGEGFNYLDPDLKRYCMASVDTPEERDEAQALGWRTFMVVPTYSQKVHMEAGKAFPDILCPATDPHPKRNATCATCALCRGTSVRAPSIWELAHGKNKENFTWP